MRRDRRYPNFAGNFSSGIFHRRCGKRSEISRVNPRGGKSRAPNLQFLRAEMREEAKGSRGVRHTFAKRRLLSVEESVYMLYPPAVTGRWACCSLRHLRPPGI